MALGKRSEDNQDGLGYCGNARKKNHMKDKETKSNKSSIALVGFVAGAVTVLLVFFAMKGC